MEISDTLTSIIEFGDQQSIDIPDQLPLMAVRDIVIYPSMIVPLFVGRGASVAAVNEAMATNKLIFLVTQKDSAEEDPGKDGLYKIGVVAVVMRGLQLPDGRLKILAQAIMKAKILTFVQEKPFISVRLKPLPEVPPKGTGVEIEALIRNVREQAEKLFGLKGVLNPELTGILNEIDDPGRLADMIASNMRFALADAQHLLELVDPLERLKVLNDLLSRELEISFVQAKIQSEAKEEMNRTQREYFLREQLRAIKKELGELDEKEDELEELREGVLEAKMPQDVYEEAMKQIDRLEAMHPDSGETSMVRTYIEWLIDLPWSSATRDKMDVAYARRVLDEEHYDLEKIKERILEYIAVRKLNRQAKGPILCFLGPPGVGKTSLGRSIARAIGRKFVRISLGGVRDEAEIRGHRRTYLGAMPGRIIQGLKRAGTNNPVFMMDEVDKIGTDFRGDPASALLEALDPEQNNSFVDHYIDLPFDLSKVIFILTANATDTIPSPLLDRLELIELSGYTTEEKKQIAMRYLIPKQTKEHGIKPDQMEITEPALTAVITDYTREAGVRELERQIGAICRKVAKRLAEGQEGPFKVTPKNLQRYLGVARYQPELAMEEDEIGVSTGLAWTPYGGEVLRIEAALVKGKGNVVITGLLGEVMKESCQAALSYTKSILEKLGIDPKFFEEKDLHVHVPSGAVPKDGPSAGITLTTAIISSALGKAVRKNVAMTGEITLRGRVLPIGGLKEKALAALRYGIETVIIPEQNLKDLEELPAYLRRAVNFMPVRHMNEVLPLVFKDKISSRGDRPVAPTF
ncbi:MAG: endopeptidase La [Deltaproteobacteria bacterium]|jgi:ATP-dependent Lon protease|nr:endopeptidase La [Deltaproteobacteria bacterium]